MDIHWGILKTLKGFDDLSLIVKVTSELNMSNSSISGGITSVISEKK